MVGDQLPVADHCGSQHPTECLSPGGQHAAAAPGLANRVFPAPQQGTGHCLEPSDQPSPAREQVLSGFGGDQQPIYLTCVTGDHGQHRQLVGRASMPEPHRQLDRREPEACWAISPARYGPHGRGRPQIRHLPAQRAGRLRPADPLGDHRREHLRIRRQKLPDPWLKRTRHRPPRRRRYFGGPSLASAACTVFARSPAAAGGCATGICSAWRRRRISAQSSMLGTCFVPSSTLSQGSQESWSKFGCR